MRFVIAVSLEPGMILAQDIINSNKAYMLKKGVALTEDYIVYIREKGYLGAYINDAEFADVCPVEPISQKTRQEAIQSVENAYIDGIIASATQIVEEVSNLDSLSIDIQDLRSFDDYTFHHCVNVAVYATAVGKFMGLPEEELEQLCQASICHDLGKLQIPLDILNKPGRLTEEEFDIIKSHARHSYDMLYGNPEISAVVRQAVLLHHENENGSGYPYGRDGSQIPLMAKILHAVDVYDALTSKRPYKDPYSPAEAFEYLTGGIGILFDESIVGAMRVVIPTYPVGMEVRLSTGEHAIVIQNTKDPARPVVKLMGSGKELALADDQNRLIFIAASGFMSLEKYTSVGQGANGTNTAPKKLDIMVVDDSIISLQQAENILSGDNYNIIPLQSGIAAINYIKAKGAPDLVIMDIDMPMLDGIKAARSLREMGHNYLPIMFLTAKGDKETVLECKSVNAIDYIVKPVRPTYLKERVERILSRPTD